MLKAIDCSKIDTKRFINNERCHQYEFISQSSPKKSGKASCSSKQLSARELLLCDYSIMSSLIELQLHCAKISIDDEALFPRNEKIVLIDEITNKMKRLKSYMLNLNSDELEIISVAMLDYRSNLDSKNRKMSGYLAEAILDHFKSAMQVSKKLEGNKKITESLLLKRSNKISNKNRLATIGYLDKYLDSRKDSNSLHKISKGIGLILVDMTTLEGWDKKLAAQEALRLLGEYLKSKPATKTPHISESVMKELNNMGIPVGDLCKFRDTLTHKQIFYLISMGDANLLQELLPSLRDIINKKIIDLETDLVKKFIDVNLEKITNHSLRERISATTKQPLNIRDFKRGISEITSKDSYYHSLPADHEDKLLVNDMYETIQKMNSVKDSKVFDHYDDITTESSFYTYRERIDPLTRENELIKLLKNKIEKGLFDLGRIPDDILQAISTSVVKGIGLSKQDKVISEENLKKYLLSDNGLSLEHVKRVTSVLDDHYSRKIQSDFHILKKVTNVYAVKSQIINLYDTLERYAKFKGESILARKIKLIRNFLSHGDALISLENDLHLTTKIAELTKKSILEKLDTKLNNKLLENINDHLFIETLFDDSEALSVDDLWLDDSQDITNELPDYLFSEKVENVLSAMKLRDILKQKLDCDKGLNILRSEIESLQKELRNIPLDDRNNPRIEVIERTLDTKLQEISNLEGKIRNIKKDIQGDIDLKIMQERFER